MVQTGIDRLDVLCKLLRGKRVGLVAGAASISRSLQCSIEVLREVCSLAVLFGPEHGVRGVLGPGKIVASGMDMLSGLPVYSLYRGGEGADAYSPPQEGMDRFDTLVFDLADAGARYFTYASSLYYAMKACAESGKQLVVLDRPNPLGGEVIEGNTHSPDLFSFIGLTPIPIRHGWTMGELASYYNGEFSLGCDLSVVPMTGWKRTMRMEDTGLPFVPPSPNLPTYDALSVYCGTCLFSGTNVSEGRGTTLPFTQIGAPYIQPNRFAAEMNDMHLPGLRFTPSLFVPHFSKYSGETCCGVQIHISDRKAVQPVALGVRMLCKLRDMYPMNFAVKPGAEGRPCHLDLASGNRDLRMGILSSDEILEKWSREALMFTPMHSRYLLYD